MTPAVLTTPNIPDQAVFDRRRIGALAPILLAIAVLIAYWNVPGNAFAFDDVHVIEQNDAIRSLGNIPRFFADSHTSSALAVNADYRPVLTASYAVNYAMSGGVIDGKHFDSWHWTSILIHFVNAWCVFLLGRRLLGSLGLAPIPGLSTRAGDVVALGAALIFAVHPVSAAAVNYISARSSSLTTMFILLSLLRYLAGLAAPRQRWNFVASLGFFVLAVLTKIEGISLFGAVILAEVLLNPATRDIPILKRAARRSSLLRIAPFAIAAALLVWLWYNRTLILNATRGGTGVTALDYFVTQLRAWWYYVGKIFAPVHLIADYPNYPRSTWAAVLHLQDKRPFIALAGWLIVGGFALLMSRRAPAVCFLILCFFVFLAPHSSFIPLFEPVNEHRPYLMDSTVIMLLCAALGLVFSRITKASRVPVAAVCLILAVILVPVTRQRNTVWRSALSLWGDTVAKDPESDRAHVNLGVALAAAGKIDQAEAHYREAIRLDPSYHYSHSNLAQVLVQRGDIRGAMVEHDLAVKVGPAFETPYFLRGEFRAQLRDIPGAAEDFQTCVRLSSSPFKALAAAAEALLRLGRDREAQPYIIRGQAMNSRAFQKEREDSRRLMGPADPMGQIADAMSWLDRGRLFEAQWCVKEALRMDPANPYAQLSMGMILDGQASEAEAAAWYDRSVKEHPRLPDPLHFRGSFHATHKRWEPAIADFRAALEIDPASLRDHAALIETFSAMGEPRKADEEAARVDVVNGAAIDQERAVFRARVFKRK